MKEILSVTVLNDGSGIKPQGNQCTGHSSGNADYLSEKDRQRHFVWYRRMDMDFVAAFLRAVPRMMC